MERSSSCSSSVACIQMRHAPSSCRRSTARRKATSCKQEAIRSHQWPSVEAIRGNQRPKAASRRSEAESCEPKAISEWQSEVISGHPRHLPSRYAPSSPDPPMKDAIKRSSAVIRGAHRVVTPHPRRIHQEGSALPMYELDACKLEPPRAQPRGKLAAARHVVGRERPNAARLMKDAIKRSSEAIRGHQRSSERPNAARLMTERVQWSQQRQLKLIRSHRRCHQSRNQGTSSVTSSRTQSGTMVALQRQLEAIEQAISSPPPAVGASSIQIRGQVRAARLHASGAARPRSRRCTRMRAPRASGATGGSS